MFCQQPIPNIVEQWAQVLVQPPCRLLPVAVDHVQQQEQAFRVLTSAACALTSRMPRGSDPDTAEVDGGTTQPRVLLLHATNTMSTLSSFTLLVPCLRRTTPIIMLAAICSNGTESDTQPQSC